MARTASTSIPTSGTKVRSRSVPPAATSTSRARCTRASAAISRASSACCWAFRCRARSRPMVDGGIGAALPRFEDARLLQGQGQYSDDFNHENQARAFVLRSPHPHARIVSIDTDVARKMPGVLLVLTGADVAAEGLKPIPHIPDRKSTRL